MSTFISRFMFGTIVGAACLAGTLLAGCSGGGIDTTGLQSPQCNSGSYNGLSLSGINPGTPFDYAELRLKAYPGVQGGSAPPVEVRSSVGNKCAKATDMTACMNAIAAPPASMSPGFLGYGCLDGPCFRYELLVNRGDKVETLTDEAAVVAMLGPIDTLQDAAWVLWMKEKRYNCTDILEGGVREVSDGYEATRTLLTGACRPLETSLVLLHIGRDASITEVQRQVLKRDDNACPVPALPSS